MKSTNNFMGFMINKNISSNEKLNKCSKMRPINELHAFVVFFPVFVVPVDFARFCGRQISKQSCCINEPIMNSNVLYM